MEANNTVLETKENLEKKFTGIHFESWLHPEKDKPGETESVINRIATYKPQFIAIDSDSPKLDSSILPPHAIFSKSKNFGYSHVYRVRGDCNFGFMNAGEDDLSEYAAESNANFWLENSQSFMELPDLDTKNNSEANMNKWMRIVSPTIFTGFLYYLAFEGDQYLTRNKNISRRSFLKGGLKVIKYSSLASFLGLLGRKELSTLEARTSNKNVNNIISDLNDKITPEFMHSGWWVNGRTALLIAKMQDSIEYMKKPHDTPASVIMGTAHDYGSTNLLNSRSARDDSIGLYANNMLDMYLGVFKRNGMSEADVPTAAGLFLDYLAATEIMAYPLVPQDDYPNQSPIAKHNIKTKNMDQGKKRYLFYSPQVFEATKNLRAS